MCYQDSYYWLGAAYEGGNRGRRLVFPATTTVEVVNQEPPPPIEVVAETAGRGGGDMKQCVCSPTRHPGSFRCRQHHAAQYEWVGVSRLGPVPRCK
ncbi:hypothetical protein CsSME_00007541 [Camellia sinensis var. sinensis]